MRGQGRGSSRGIAALLAASVCYGSAAILIRLAKGVHPVALAFYRLALSSVIVLAGAAALGTLRKPARWEAKALASSGVALGLHFIAFVASVKMTSVANATFLVNTSPVFVALAAPLALGEKTSRVEALCVTLATAGIALASLGGLTRASAGDALAVAAAVLLAAYTLLGRKLRAEMPTTCYISYVYTSASLVAMAACLAIGVEVAKLYPGEVVAAIVALAVVPTVFGHGLYNYALGSVKAVVANTVPILEPVVASTLALLLFSEKPAPQQLAGYAMIAVSVAVIAARRQPS
ncbi:MAG: hypothetical protein DRN96_05880 [Thermoproteota archaeon]|nr:MAG: hypothetical protein DRN96_05880 [Candidatus Korarchaeota archaeon]